MKGETGAYKIIKLLKTFPKYGCYATSLGSIANAIKP